MIHHIISEEKYALEAHDNLESTYMLDKEVITNLRQREAMQTKRAAHAKNFNYQGKGNGCYIRK